jgi:hypothetical protein
LKARVKDDNDIDRVGAALPKVPQSMVKRFALEGIKHKHRHWVARGKCGYYKLAPVGSLGERHLQVEGELLDTFDHPNIVKGSLLSADGWKILRVDLIDGEPLTSLRDQLSTSAKMQILEEIESAVGYVNARGILHADVCGPNVLWTGSRSYLIDFEEAIRIGEVTSRKDSPDLIGGAPCCWGDVGYGYDTYLCVESLRTWLLAREFCSLKAEVIRAGVWNPHSAGNLCDPWSTPNNGSVYQTVHFGNETVIGQRDPDLRFRRLSTSKKLSFWGTRVLDIGCNFGRLGAFLDRFDIASYVGVDLEKNYIAVAAKLAELEGRKSAQFLVGDVCSLATIEALEELCPQGYDMLIFEGPIDESKYLLKNTWQEEKEFLTDLGYREIWESDENDFIGRIFGVFEKRPLGE